MVNVLGKFPENAINNTAYNTNGSDVREATAEERIRYRDANKHKKKRALDVDSSTEPSRSGIVVATKESTKSRSVSTQGEWKEGGASSTAKTATDKNPSGGRDRSRDSDSRDSSRRRESRESERGRAPSKEAVTSVGLGRHQEVDEEEADRREMAEIQGRIEARKTAKDLAVAHATLEGLRASIAEPIPTTSARGSKRAEKETKPDSKTRESRRETKRIPAVPAKIEMPVVAKVARRIGKNIPKKKISGEEEGSL